MTDLTTTEPAHLDPYTATADGARQAVYDRLTELAPIHRQRFPSGVVGWLITGYDAARAALTDPRLVKGGPGHGPFADQMRPDVSAAIDRHLLALDPPDHTRLRRLLSTAFTRRRSELLAPRIQELTDDLLDRLDDRLAAGEAVDLIAEFAYPLPIAVICELLGVPEGDRADFRAWTGPLVAGGQAGFEAYEQAATGLVEYVRELLARKRQEPGDDLLSALIAAHDEDGDRLTEDELTAMVYLLLIAGHETTVNLIANGVRALLLHPEQLALLRSEPGRIGFAVEELLRYDGPLQSAIPTIAAAPLEIGGVQVAPGEAVVISLLAANRDPARTAGADRLDLSRPAPHLAFGHGIHRCVGAPLAQVEARIALGTLIGRFDRLELAVPTAELTRTPGLLMNALVTLPVRLGEPG